MLLEGDYILIFASSHHHSLTPKAATESLQGIFVFRFTKKHMVFEFCYEGVQVIITGMNTDVDDNVCSRYPTRRK